MPVQLSHQGRVAVVVMDRPEARNAMNMEMTEQLDATYDQLASDDTTWVVVLTGAGDRAFCAGQDLKEVGLVGRRRSENGFGGITRREFPKPLIAAVNGFALGGGFEICLACDLVVAEEHATFGLPEVKRGIFAGAGGLVRLGTRVPMAVALEMAMTGAPVSARRALELGLVNRVVPSGQSVPAAMELANVICEAAPLSVRLSKRVIRASVTRGEEGLFALQAELGAELLQSEDAREGPRAFVEKRAPRWAGR
ncbi:MAG TPA: crotonase/enoyl-CoA hydratase family protein [Chloroflexota bacterium]